MDRARRQLLSCATLPENQRRQIARSDLLDEVVGKGRRELLPILVLASFFIGPYPLALVFNSVNPILAQGAALRAGLADGTIDCVATDHAPHPVEAKESEWAEAAFGMTGLETALRVVQRAMVETGLVVTYHLACTMQHGLGLRTPTKAARADAETLADQVILQAAPVSFDASVWEMVMAAGSRPACRVRLAANARRPGMRRAARFL